MASIPLGSGHDGIKKNLNTLPRISSLCVGFDFTFGIYFCSWKFFSSFHFFRFPFFFQTITFQRFFFLPLYQGWSRRNKNFIYVIQTHNKNDTFFGVTFTFATLSCSFLIRKKNTTNE